MKYVFNVGFVMMVLVALLIGIVVLLFLPLIKWVA
jgi:hypothetical protein